LPIWYVRIQRTIGAIKLDPNRVEIVQIAFNVADINKSPDLLEREADLKDRMAQLFTEQIGLQKEAKQFCQDHRAIELTIDGNRQMINGFNSSAQELRQLAELKRAAAKERQ